MRSIQFKVDVDDVYVDNRGNICANIQIKWGRNNIRSRVIDITQLLKQEPPR